MVLPISFLSALGLSILVNLVMESAPGPIPIIGSFLRLALTHNRYIAFSIALPSVLQSLLIAGAFSGVCVAAWRSKDMLSRLAFGLIIGGACANILDRLLDGTVTDYVIVGTFPVFNVADICITLGAGLLIVEGLAAKHRN